MLPCTMWTLIWPEHSERASSRRIPRAMHAQDVSQAASRIGYLRLKLPTALRLWSGGALRTHTFLYCRSPSAGCPAFSTDQGPGKSSPWPLRATAGGHIRARSYPSHSLDTLSTRGLSLAVSPPAHERFPVLLWGDALSFLRPYSPVPLRHAARFALVPIPCLSLPAPAIPLEGNLA